MKILKEFKVPTGSIFIVEGELGKLEMLSLGDYGKAVNVKCDSMGLTRELDKVEHTQLMPLKEKWVITISTQYGCSMNCNFCDVPKVGPGRNATFNDLWNQVWLSMCMHSEVVSSKRLNIHFARMGEPTWNPNVLDAARFFKKQLDQKYKVHPVVSSMVPWHNGDIRDFFIEWMKIKNELYEGNAGLQLSINSTNEDERQVMFNGNASKLYEIAIIMEDIIPIGRKITLNFALAGYEIDPSVLLRYFNPKHYIIKLTPMHKTLTALEHDIKTFGDYTTYTPYKKDEEDLKAAGYDVLVFIASQEEDLGRITCGNAILSGSKPLTDYKEITTEDIT